MSIIKNIEFALPVVMAELEHGAVQSNCTSNDVVVLHALRLHWDAGMASGIAGDFNINRLLVDVKAGHALALAREHHDE